MEAEITKDLKSAGKFCSEDFSRHFLRGGSTALPSRFHSPCLLRRPPSVWFVQKYGASIDIKHRSAALQPGGRAGYDRAFSQRILRHSWSLIRFCPRDCWSECIRCHPDWRCGLGSTPAAPRGAFCHKRGHLPILSILSARC